ncbi:MAG: MFS transporter [Thermoplasmataceae archaeon]
MRKLSPVQSVALMLILRFVYAMNWYNVSPYLTSITGSYSQGASASGLILSAFLLGAGLFQIPSGFIASRIGARNVALWGMIIMSVSVFLSPLSPDFIVFLISRFFVGLASAFFFSSGIVLLGQIDKRNIDGKITMFNVSFAAGGGFGIILFGELGRYIQWQPSLYIAGIITIIPSVIALAMIPDPGIRRKSMKGVISKLNSPLLLLLSFGIAGYWALNLTAVEFLNPYTLFTTGSVNYAGIVGSLALFSGILGIFILPFARKIKPMHINGGLVILLSVLVIMIPLVDVIGLGVIALIEGIFSITIFSAEYYYVVLLEQDETVVPLSIATMNTIQIGFGSFVAFVFSLIYSSDKTLAWYALGLISLITLPLSIPALLKVEKLFPKSSS